MKLILNGFIDRGTDIQLCSYLKKSYKTVYIQPGTGPDGHYHKGYTKKVEVKDEVKDGLTERGSKPIHTQREQIPATPFNITDKTRHLVPWKQGDELPEHIKNLKKPIPPNWRHVMISPDPDAKIQVIGKDGQNRPQYIYHNNHIELSKSAKFSRIQELLGRQDELHRFISNIDDKETGDCLQLILETGIRPGSTRDTRAKVEALGATTLRGENVVIDGGDVFLRFIGKEGVPQNHKMPENLAKMLLKRKNDAGDKGNLFKTNDRRLRIALKPFGIVPKDLRTLIATKTASELLSDIEPVESAKEFAKIRNQIGDSVCSILGNKRKMALDSYIDPNVFMNWSPKGMNAWLDATKTGGDK